MTDEIELLRELRPAAGGPRPELARRARGELMAAIEAERRGARRRRAVRFAVPALAAVAAAAAGLVVAGRGSDPAWAASAVRVAEAAPRLLVGESGWQVTRADEFTGDTGEMTFANGSRTVDLRWQPGTGGPSLVKDRAHGNPEVAKAAPVDGGTARVFRYAGTSDFTALWMRGDHMLELRGVAAGKDEFLALLASLHGVDVNTWLSAMPASVVKPSGHGDAVERMLADMPQPPGFDAAALRRGDAVRDRYQLGAQVAGAVACAWIHRWVAARAAGDDAAAREAVTALAGSHDWAILREMSSSGDYPKVLWEYADAMASDSTVMGGKPLTVESSYKAALGCS